MGCVCCSLSTFVSIALDALERVTLCTVCAMLTCCLFFTVLFVLVVGVGIGYHYCFVQNSVESMAKAAKAAGAVRSGPEKGHVLRSADKIMQRGSAHRLQRRDNSNRPLPESNSASLISNVSRIAAANITKLYASSTLMNNTVAY